MSEIQGHPAFEALNQLGHVAAEAGRLDEAFELFDRLHTLAQEIGEERLIDLAFCNRSTLLVIRGKAERVVPRLREILMRNSDPVNARLAAYNLSRHFEVIKSFKKAMFYARIAHQRSHQIGREDWIASSHNQVGNILLAESFVEPAVEEFGRALASMPSNAHVWRAQILTNLGYCRIVQHRHEEGFTLLFRSLRTLIAHGAEAYQIAARLDLCYAYLEIGRYARARQHGEAGLAAAERIGDNESMKNALYLLGEASNLSGLEGSARRYFGRLQNDFFPKADYLTPMLLAVNVRKLVNLHA